MGKKRMQVRQVRQKTRVVKPKAPAAAAPASPDQQRKQQQRFLQSGGFLQAYSPDLVMRIGYISGAICLVCLLIALELVFGPLRPADLVVRIVAAVLWIAPIVVVTSVVAPGVRLAMADRKAEPKVVQGQLMGASDVSNLFGLGMLMVKTRGGNEQFFVEPGKLAKVPGNQVNAVVTVTPRLGYVRSVAIMPGQQMMPRPRPPVPPILFQLRLLPLVMPAGVALGLVLGGDALALIPIPGPWWLHALLVVVAAAALGGGAYLGFFLYQRRLSAQAQALIPGGIG